MVWKGSNVGRDLGYENYISSLDIDTIRHLCCLRHRAMAYVTSNTRKLFNVSSGLVPPFGDRILKSKFGGIVDVLTVFALVGGVAGSLGYGILQLGSGISVVFGIDTNVILYILIAFVIFLAYTATSISG